MARPPVTAGDRLELDDIQGLVLFAFSKSYPWGCYLFLRILDAVKARAWLAGLAPQVTSAAAEDRGGATRMAVALSVTGLRALGLAQELIERFAQEFQEGMHAAERSRQLGDTGESAPENWTLGGPAQPLDVLLMLFAKDQGALDRLVAEHERALGGACLVVARELAPKRTSDREHFGFRDGISQPWVEGAPHVPAGASTVRAGEFLLGYRNEYGTKPQSPHLADGTDLGKNGTYVVFRKLRQDVGAFWRYFNDNARGPDGRVHPHGAEYLAAKAVGRWPSGAPFEKAPTADDPSHRDANEFDFRADRDGLQCPITSHIRRANPRAGLTGDPEESLDVVKRHRILRRGRPFGDSLDRERARRGDDDGAVRGLYFIGISASIARGFEFIQRTWMNNRNFLGLYDDGDPIVGDQDPLRPGHLTIPEAPYRLRLAQLPRFVRVLGGGYFWMPGRAALQRLVSA